jgi:hypothetical protein
MKRPRSYDRLPPPVEVLMAVAAAVVLVAVILSMGCEASGCQNVCTGL